MLEGWFSSKTGFVLPVRVSNPRSLKEGKKEKRRKRERREDGSKRMEERQEEAAWDKGKARSRRRWAEGAHGARSGGLPAPTCPSPMASPW